MPNICKQTHISLKLNEMAVMSLLRYQQRELITWSMTSLNSPHRIEIEDISISRPSELLVVKVVRPMP